MPASRPALSVRIFDHAYALDAPASSHPHLRAIARQLDETMRTYQTRQPEAGSGQLAILAALDLLQASNQCADDVNKALAALHRKLDRLEAAITPTAGGTLGTAPGKR